jgi:hypothetical protein
VKIELCTACGEREARITRRGRRMCIECARTVRDAAADAKVIALPVVPRADVDSIVDLPPIRVREAWRDHIHDPDKCHHPSIVVRDGIERGVECGTCAAELDPISILMQYAHRDRRILDTLEGLRAAKKAAQKEAEAIHKSSVALRRKRAADVAKHPILGVLVGLKANVARRLKAHPDEDVARMRGAMRAYLDDAINTAIRRIEEASDET